MQDKITIVLDKQEIDILITLLGLGAQKFISGKHSGTANAYVASLYQKVNNQVEAQE